MASEVSPVGSPMARKRSTAPSGGRGVFNRRMRSGAMRPVRRFSMAAVAPMFLVMSFVLSVRLVVLGSVESNTGVADRDLQAWAFHLSGNFALLEGGEWVAKDGRRSMPGRRTMPPPDPPPRARGEFGGAGRLLRLI